MRLEVLIRLDLSIGHDGVDDLFVPRHVRLGWPRELVLPEMRSETDFGERACFHVALRGNRNQLDGYAALL